MGHYSDITVIISNALLAPRHIVKERRQTEWQTERERGRQTKKQKGRETEKQKSGEREGRQRDE